MICLWIHLKIESKKAKEDSKYAHRSGIQFLSLVYHLQSPKYMARIKGKICYFAVKWFCKQGGKQVCYIQKYSRLRCLLRVNVKLVWQYSKNQNQYNKRGFFIFIFTYNFFSKVLLLAGVDFEPTFIHCFCFLERARNLNGYLSQLCFWLHPKRVPSWRESICYLFSRQLPKINI